MLPGSHFYPWLSYSWHSRFIPGIIVIPGTVYPYFQEPAPGVCVVCSISEGKKLSLFDLEGEIGKGNLTAEHTYIAPSLKSGMPPLPQSRQKGPLNKVGLTYFPA